MPRGSFARNLKTLTPVTAMRIVFINYSYYLFASGVHIHFLANELGSMGHQCTVVLPNKDNCDMFGQPEYSFSTYEEFAGDIAAGRYGKDTILHAWTPRENSREVCLLAAKTLGIPYFVHLEDNERRILESYYKQPFRELLRQAASGTLEIRSSLSHPIFHQAFLAEAAGVSVLIDRLAEFVPPGTPCSQIWPACEKDFFRLPQKPDLAMRKSLGIADDEALIVYPGNVHHAVAKTVAQLYRALPLIKAAGHPVRILRCAGADHVMDPDLAPLMREYALSMPALPPKNLPAALSMADLLVQPGEPDDFDEYRFPSKLPLFLASGRPVILARTNLGRFLTDRENCLILEENTPERIAAHVCWLLEHPQEAALIGHNGRKFAAANFSWRKSAQKLLELYHIGRAGKA